MGFFLSKLTFCRLCINICVCVFVFGCMSVFLKAEYIEHEMCPYWLTLHSSQGHNAHYCAPSWRLEIKMASNSKPHLPPPCFIYCILMCSLDAFFFLPQDTQAGGGCGWRGWRRWNGVAVHSSPLPSLSSCLINDFTYSAWGQALRPQSPGYHTGLCVLLHPAPAWPLTHPDCSATFPSQCHMSSCSPSPCLPQW